MTSDILLWDQLKQGQKNALEKIYQTHIEALLQYSCRFTQDRELVEDQIQDLFIYLWQKRDTLGTTDSIRRYLLVALRRRLFKRTQTPLSEIKEDHSTFALELNQEDQWIQNEETNDQHHRLQTAMQELTGRQREAVYLKYFEQLSYEEICQIMDLNYQSVRNLISQGISSLRKHFVLFFLIFCLFIEYIT